MVPNVERHAYRGGDCYVIEPSTPDSGGSWIHSVGAREIVLGTECKGFVVHFYVSTNDYDRQLEQEAMIEEVRDRVRTIIDEDKYASLRVDID